MPEIQYLGERLWAGQLGHFFVSLSFAAAFFSFLTFYLSARNSGMLPLARLLMQIHGLAVVGIAGTLFYMLFNHFFEYQYVWQHSNTDMDMKYILSCFWEGQEGSFLLWTFWNIVLALLLHRQLKHGEWEAPVMAVMLLVQTFLASMILGVYIGDYRIGSNPFLLLREHPDFMNLPMVKVPDYLRALDGRGLNPLLMNYWMTIHPPTLFLGFSSTLIPFSFALAGLFKRDYTSWQRLALPWTYFSVLVLGVGILMGGAWAYEALSFGGFWAWDPVENSSLVPWLVLVAAAHTMIINHHRGGSLFTTHFLAIAAFLLVLYSTFLTRSGILGNASVHAFTDLGMTGQLVIYVLTFVFISTTLLIADKLVRVSYIVFSLLLLAAAATYDIAGVLILVWLCITLIATAFSYYLWFPKENQEEELYSREFWMFLGSLVLVIVSLIITFFTSIPVINKLFNTQFAPPQVPLYNQWMLPFSILLMILIAAAQFLKYRKDEPRIFYKKLALSFFAALAFGLACALPLYWLSPNAQHESSDKLGYSGLLVVGLFAVFANADYAIRVFKGGVRMAGASIAHVGFALLLIGALVSTSKKIVLSKNTADRKVSGLGKDYDDRKSILLTQGDTLPMGPYLVTYAGKTREGINVQFKVDYFSPDKEKKKLRHAFSLFPKVQDNPRMGKAPEPDTRHFADHDIYTHVTYADLEVDTAKNSLDKYGTAKNYVGHVGDTIFASNAIVVIDSLRTSLSREEYLANDSLLKVTAVLRAMDVRGNRYYGYPDFVISNNVIIPKESEIEKLGLKFVFWKINPNEGTIEITMSEKASNNRDFIVMEAYVFPYINVLWVGCIVMALGTGIAIAERIRKFRLQRA